MSQNLHDAVVGLLMIGGALMSLAAAVGLMRFPDLMSRMHAASKPQVLGLLLFLSAIAVEFASWKLLPVLFLCWLLMLLTAPVSAHMIGRAGYRTKHLRPELLSIDELDDVVERAQRYITEAQEAEEDVDADPQVDDVHQTGNLSGEELAAAREADGAGGSRSRRRLEG
ncbi:Na(+)/H(+) antiporter subunit G [Arthrobacter saudimassiliensis]|uniref:Na(+)/H(+) antiporter subunit G n=1 Tax=Arthrobacter saudimassiliensis TaxID=1461584 RepID=A0A078MSA2_9MICC|nr:Na(+)/H(+) antiporter subunit G [Arthrobacter saudimassiliensis]